MSFFRNHAVGICGISTTVIVGAGATFLYLRLADVRQELRILNVAVASMRAEFTEIRSRLSNSIRLGNKRPFFSHPTSSGEDDEEYLDAHGGSDLETEVGSKFLDNLPPKDAFFENIDKLFDGSTTEQDEAYHLLLKSKERHPTDVEYLWRLSKACYLVSCIMGAQGHHKKKKELTYMALDNASDALKLNDECGNAHKWFAITLGNAGDYESTHVKIKNGFDIKKHIEKAIELNPNDASNYHMLGRWCYSVYMLTWIERKAAATLFATPPTATVDDALEAFMKAENYKPGHWKENMLYIAKCHVENTNYSDATLWLEKAERIESKNLEDENIQKEITHLLYKYRR